MDDGAVGSAGERAAVTFRIQRIWLAVVLIAGIATVFALADVRDGRTRAVVAGVFVVFACWLGRVRVTARPDGVVVVNAVARGGWLPWDRVGQIHRVTVPGVGLTGEIRLRAGGRIRIDALSVGMLGSEQALERRIAQLERIRLRHRSAGSGAPGGPRTRRLLHADGYWQRVAVQAACGWVIGGLLVGVGLGGHLLREAIRFRDNGRPATAQVTDVYGSKYKTVVVAYDVGGVHYVEEAGAWSGTPHVGDSVAVVYDVTDPGRVTDADGAGDTLEGYLFLMVGLGLIGWGVCALARTRRWPAQAWQFRRGGSGVAVRRGR